METSKGKGSVVWTGVGRGCGAQDRYYIRIACAPHFFPAADNDLQDRLRRAATHEIHLWREQPGRIPARVEICREQRDLATPLRSSYFIAWGLSEALAAALQYNAPLQMLRIEEPRFRASHEEIAFYWSQEIDYAYRPLLKAALASRDIPEVFYWKLRDYYLNNYPAGHIPRG